MRLKLGIQFVAAWHTLTTWVRVNEETQQVVGVKWLKDRDICVLEIRASSCSSVCVVSYILPTSCSDKEMLVEQQDRPVLHLPSLSCVG